MINILLFGLSAFTYAVTNLLRFGTFRFSRNDKSFFGLDSDSRKYKEDAAGNRFPPKDNWYYRVNRIKFLEKFPGSATIFVNFTDGYHFLQFIGSKLLFAAMSNPSHFWFSFFFLWGVYSLFWNLGQFIFKK